MTAETAMAEIWAIMAPDCSPDEYEKIVDSVRQYALDTAYEPTSEVLHERVHKLFNKIQQTNLQPPFKRFTTDEYWEKLYKELDESFNKQEVKDEEDKTKLPRGGWF